MGTTRKNVQFSIKNAGVVGEKTVRAVVTAPTLDRDGDVIDTESLRLPLKGGGVVVARDLTGTEELAIPFQLDHSFSVKDTIGSFQKAIINEDGELEGEFVFSSRKEAQDAFTLVDEGHLHNAFSITVMYDFDDMESNYIYNAEIIEISLVFAGSNRNARVLAVAKSLLGKEGEMSKDLNLSDLTADELAELKAKIEEAEEKAKHDKEDKKKDEEEKQSESKEVEEVAEEQTEVDEQSPETEAEATEEAEGETEAEPVEAEDTTEEVENTNVKEEEEMEASKSVAQKAAATTPSEVDQPVIKTEQKHTSKDVIALTAKQINAKMRKDYATLAELNKEAMRFDEIDGRSQKSIKSKELSYEDTSPLYVTDAVWREVEQKRDTHGRLVAQTSRITLTDSTAMRVPTKTYATGFKPVGFDGAKDANTGTFGDVKVEPKPFAYIQVWNDHAANDAAVNLFNLLTEDVAFNLDRLEDSIIIDFEGGTFDGDEYNASGLLEKLGAGQTVEFTQGDGEDFFAKMLQAVGELNDSDAENAAVAVSRATLTDLAGLRDSEGRLIFPNSGNTLNMGLVGALPYVVSATVPRGDLIVGNWRHYYSAAKEGLELTTNNLGVVGSTNLYQSDKSALRAVVRRDGNISDASVSGGFRIVRSTS